MTSDKVLFLNSQDVQNLLSLDQCIGAVEEAFQMHGKRKAASQAVISMHTHGGGFHVKAGLLELDDSYFAAKINGNFTDNCAIGLPTIQGIVVLCNATNGTPLAILDSREITSIRTAAATAVAAKYLVRNDARVVTVCGCGVQGRVQLRGLSRVCRFEKVFAYDKDFAQASRFASELTTSLAIEVIAVTQLSPAVRQSDVCVTCTTSRKPVLLSEDVAPGTFIAAVGADNPGKQELDPWLFLKSKIVCDVMEQCAEMGDLYHALDKAVVCKSDVHAELGEIVAGLKTGRESSTEVIVFDSTGMALQDVAAAACLYTQAKQRGAGVELDFAA